MSLMRPIDLNGQWQFIKDPKDIGESEGYFRSPQKFKKAKKISVPSNWETAGIENYSGTVWFYREIDKVDISDDEDAILHFMGADYFCKVWLNGEYLGEHEGYFQPFEFDVADKAGKKTKNILIVKVSSPAEKTGKDDWPHKKKLIKGVFGHHDVRPGAWSEKLGQSHGTGGIWNDVSISILPKVRISGIKVSPVLKDNYKTAELDVEIFIENKSNNDISAKVELEISYWLLTSDKQPSPVKKIELDAAVLPGVNVCKTKIEIRNPFLWWPWDHGEQNLYVMNAKLFVPSAGQPVSEAVQRFGIREIKISEKDKGWILNGRKIFIRGSNIIPEEYLSTYTAERIKKDVGIIKDANCNAVRVHAHINRKELYDALDEAGIMVWQDFPLQWEYVDTREFIEEACRQIKDMVNLLHNNPCVMLWCCHNEPVVTGKAIDSALYQAVKEEDRTRITIKASDFHEHPYPGWFWGHYRYYFALPGKPFPTEFGAQALPGIDTLKKMFEKKDLWPPKWGIWAYRDFVYEQTFHIAGVRRGKSINEFIKNSQAYQSGLIKYAVERYRQHKGSEISGMFHFMLLEPWPAVSYSVTDYFRNPKKGFFTLKTCFQPVLVIASLQRRTFGPGNRIEGQFWVVNDYFRDFYGAKLAISVKRGGKVLIRYSNVMIDIERDTCKEITNIVYSNTKGLELPSSAKEGPCEMVMEVYDAFGAFLSANTEELILEKIPKEIKQFNAEFIWE
ncbi:MAG: hypothetical protein NTZ10_06070 [Candidatus Saganbacteria bacterium]|nr:hypothetical protein [Candidatus Saganbacteria bacterium]